MSLHMETYNVTYDSDEQLVHDVEEFGIEPRKGEVIYAAVGADCVLGVIEIERGLAEPDSWVATELAIVPGLAEEDRLKVERRLLACAVHLGSFIGVQMQIPAELANGCTDALKSHGYEMHGQVLVKMHK